MADFQGADAPMSGLAAMLVAAEILANYSDPTTFSRQIVFAALAGEPWGSMGSKRLLWEMDQGNNSTEDLHLSSIEQVGKLLNRLLLCILGDLMRAEVPD